MLTPVSSTTSLAIACLQVSSKSRYPQGRHHFPTYSGSGVPIPLCSTRTYFTPFLSIALTIPRTATEREIQYSRPVSLSIIGKFFVRNTNRIKIF